MIDIWRYKSIFPHRLADTGPCNVTHGLPTSLSRWVVSMGAGLLQCKTGYYNNNSSAI